ncbi:50S ribosomal protein L2 [Candidatus Woesearchaeota archaeon]|nr:50S ribosomal protein L2 [Candidatus Woesearchaeota archaeon]
MGKRLIQQARGKGGPTYRAPSFNYKGEAKVRYNISEAEIKDIVKCRGHSAPLIEVLYPTENGTQTGLMIASEGLRVGQKLQIGSDSVIKNGNVLPLMEIPEGTRIFNIESVPGDGGKFIRAGGSFGIIVGKTKDGIKVKLPSKKVKVFNIRCRATIGRVAGSGRKEKPFLKAGNKYYYKKAKNKLYPVVSGTAQNAVDHPFGNSRSLRKGRSRPISRHAPPGRKVGLISPKQTGRKRGKIEKK